MRARNIKPGFFRNECLAEMDCMGRLLFIGLWCIADRKGVLEYRPKKICAEVFPYDGVDEKKLNGYLTVMERLGHVILYSVAEKPYIKIVNFEKHQRPHHTERDSGLPDYSIENQDVRCLTVNSPLEHGENPPDSLIPDSLIPDSLIQEDPPKPPKGETPFPEFYDPVEDAHMFRRHAKGYSLTEAWEVCRQYGEWDMRTHGVNVERVLEKAEKFKRYFTGPDAKKPVKKDWFRTWKNWSY